MNGLPRLSVLDIAPAPQVGQVKLAVKLANTGSGECEDGLLEVMVSRERLGGTFPQADKLSHHPLEPVKAGGEAVAAIMIQTAKWEAGVYSFQCRVGFRRADGQGMEGTTVQYAGQGALPINSPDFEFDLKEGPQK